MSARTPLPPDPSPPSAAGIRRGLGGFVLLTAAGLVALFHFTFPEDAGSVVARLSPAYLGLALLSTAADVFLGPLRFHVFLRKMAPGTSFWLAFRADLVGRFLGSLTPSQSGGGPAQIWVLCRGGIRLPVVLSVLVVNLVASLIFLLGSGGFAAWIFREELRTGALRHLALWGAVVLGAVLLFLVVSAARPGRIAGPLLRLVGAMEGRRGRWAERVRRSCQTLVDTASQYQSSCRTCLRRWPSLPVAAAVLAAVLYLNKFTLGWFLVRGLGVEAPYLTTVAVQALLHFVLFVAPTPGGSGIAEVSTGALMSVVLPVHLLAPFTLAFRFLLGYLPAALGGVALAVTLRRSRKDSRRAVNPGEPRPVATVADSAPRPYSSAS